MLIIEHKNFLGKRITYNGFLLGFLSKQNNKKKMSFHRIINDKQVKKLLDPFFFKNFKQAVFFIDLNDLESIGIDYSRRYSNMSSTYSKRYYKDSLILLTYKKI